MTEIEQQIEELTRLLQEIKMQQAKLDGQLQLAEARLQILRPTAAEKTETVTSTAESLQIAGNSRKSGASNNNKNAIGPSPRKAKFGMSNEWEDFIGTNVISKIGIVVTIIGVFIG